jgi:hypothetical protein
MAEDSDEEIIIKNNIDNSIGLKYLPKIKSNFDLISNYNYDIKEILYKGCIYLPNLLCDTNNKKIFNKILIELSEMKIEEWSKHHKIDNPTESKTFNSIVNCLSKYFNIKVLATRLNYYTETDFKPFHHDSHAYTNGIKEDITIGLSLGDSRHLTFKHVESNNFFNFPQNNGDVFCFDYLTNLKFQHGISKLKNINIKNTRISIILWGKKI